MTLDEFQTETYRLRRQAIYRFTDDVDDLVRVIRAHTSELSRAIGEISPAEAWAALGREIASRFPPPPPPVVAPPPLPPPGTRRTKSELARHV